METTKRRHPLRKLLQFGLLALVATLLASCASSDGYGGGAGNFHTVIVDAGHGGHDRGARPVNGAYEKDLALDTSLRVARVLRGKGFKVIETRTSDNFIPLERRAAISNSQSGAIFVSIHYNWAKRSGATGLETYYYSPRSKRLAANIQKEIRGAYPTKNRGVKYARYHVLRNNKRPAVLCELGFVSSSYDNRYVQNASYRQKLADEIVAGIIAEQRGRNP
jgi:N-acetylmuramoyl-L-alanine amidase